MRHPTHSIFITLLLLVLSCSVETVDIKGAVSAQSIKPEKYVFKVIGNMNLNLWVYRPRSYPEKANSGLSPAIILFHGGGWQNGSPQQMEPQAKYLSDSGIVSILAEYRLTHQRGKPPIEALGDVKSALRWVRANSSRLGIDPKRLAAGGGSAGGHLAVATAVVSGYDDPTDDLSISTVPDALVLFNPVLDLTVRWRQRFGADAVSISPIQQLRKPIPPTIIFQGTEDTVAPYSTAQNFVQLALSLGSPRVTLVPLAGRRHGFFSQRKKKEGGGDFDVTLVATRSFFEEIGWLRVTRHSN